MNEVCGSDAPLASPVRKRRIQFRLMHLVGLVVTSAIALRFPLLIGLVGIVVFLAICAIPPLLYIHWIESWFTLDDDASSAWVYLVAGGLFVSMFTGVILGGSVMVVAIS